MSSDQPASFFNHRSCRADHQKLLCVDFANMELQLLDGLSDGSLTPEDFARAMTKRVRVPFVVPTLLLDSITQLDTEADRRLRKMALADYVTSVQIPVHQPRRAAFRPPAPKRRNHR